MPNCSVCLVIAAAVVVIFPWCLLMMARKFSHLREHFRSILFGAAATESVSTKVESAASVCLVVCACVYMCVCVCAAYLLCPLAIQI